MFVAFLGGGAVIAAAQTSTALTGRVSSPKKA